MPKLKMRQEQKGTLLKPLKVVSFGARIQTHAALSPSLTYCPSLNLWVVKHIPSPPLNLERVGSLCRKDWAYVYYTHYSLPPVANTCYLAKCTQMVLQRTRTGYRCCRGCDSIRNLAFVLFPHPSLLLWEVVCLWFSSLLPSLATVV